MTRPSWLGRAVRNEHRHAVEQASRRWRWGRRDGSNDFHTGQEKTIYVLTTVTAIFLPLQFVTGLFGMNFKYMPQLNDRGAYYLLLWICLIYTVLALALVWWCSSGRRRSLKHHDIEAV